MALLNYKKWFMIYLLFQMIWYPDTQLFKIGGSWINLNLICAVYFVVLYFLKRNKIAKDSINFPFSRPMFLIAFSLFITCFTSYSGFVNELVKAIGLILMDLVVVYIIWKTINSREDFVFLYKGITIIIFVACIYIFFEKITNLNPVLDYKITCTSNVFSTYRDFQQWDLRGYRCYSIFDHTICASMIFALYASLTLNLFVYKNNFPFKPLAMITSAMCIPAIFFTQQRTGIVLFLISALAIIDLKKIRFWKLMGLAGIISVLIVPFLLDNLSLLFSIFNSKFANDVSGSSISLRFKQLYAIFNIMLISPLTGLGENFQRYYTGIHASQALGYESLWFEQMAKHGSVGILAYLYMIYYSIIKIPKKYKSKHVFYIMLAYWITYTMTSTPYFRTYFLYAIIFYFIKDSKKYKDIKDINNEKIHVKELYK